MTITRCGYCYAVSKNYHLGHCFSALRAAFKYYSSHSLEITMADKPKRKEPMTLEDRRYNLMIDPNNCKIRIVALVNAKMTSKEAEIILSFGEQLKTRGWLTERQAEILEEIYNRRTD